MSVNNFVPQIWSDEVLLNLHRATVFEQLCNRDYEGDISGPGDTVRINAIGAVTVSAYAKNTKLGEPQVLSDAGTTMQLSQASVYNVLIDDIDKRQAAGDLQEALLYEAGFGVANDADKYIAQQMALNAGQAIGTGTAPQNDLAPSTTVEYDRTTAILYINQAEVMLDNAGVPDDGKRWIVVPPWMAGVIKNDKRFISFGTPQNRADLAMGALNGEILGFTVYKSLNVQITNTTTYQVVAGHPMAVTYADDLLNVEAMRSSYYFADIFRGLHVYGCKVVRPSALVVVNVTAPSGWPTTLYAE